MWPNSYAVEGKVPVGVQTPFTSTLWLSPPLNNLPKRPSEAGKADRRPAVTDQH